MLSSFRLKKKTSFVGNFGEEEVNDNGCLLMEICNTFQFQIMNGYFQNKNIHKYTWVQPTHYLKTIIDYYIQRQQFNINTVDIRAFRGAKCGTDHIWQK